MPCRLMVQADSWSKVHIETHGSAIVPPTSLQCAIREWNKYLRNSTSRLLLPSYPVRYIDTCFGARCNPQCPEVVQFGVVDDFWPERVQYSLVGLTLLVTLVCISYKIVMVWRKRDFLRNYDKFIEWERLRSETEKKGVTQLCK